ncbi:MAG: YbaK/EbsC family protein, partial [Clostridiaceae bacterium]
MKMKKMLIPTLRDVPSDAESMGHKLLVRGGFIRKTNSGLFTYLPLGAKVLENIEKLVKDTLDEEGFQEVILPSIATMDTLESTGADKEYGSELFKFRDRNSISNLLIPSYEETAIETIKADLKSYKQLPLRLYTISSRFKDEERPRLGLTRTREFKTCDVFSFDKDEESASQTSGHISNAFESIFKKLELNPVKADAHPGLNGVNAHKYITPLDLGEETVWFNKDESNAATDDVARVHLEYGENDISMEELKWMETPGCITIDDVSEYLKVPASHCAKAMDLMVKNKPVLVMIPGDRELCMPKLTKYLKVTEKDIVMMMDHEIIELFGSKPGFTGPKGIKAGVRIILDERVTKMKNLVIGTNEVNSHFINANFGRDFEGEIAEDLVQISDGDINKDTKEPLKSIKGTS